MRVTRPMSRSYRDFDRHGQAGSYGHCPTRAGEMVAVAPLLASTGDAGPAYKGMDPSDPLTYVRRWNPQPGMIAYLNFDGAAMQDRAPAGGLARGSQARGRKGTQ